MIQALAAFLDFCYIVRQSSLDEADLDALDNALQHFETERVIFETEGIHSDGISIPRIHALKHYREAIELFGAPNGISTSIVESKHIRAVKMPYQRSNKNEELGQVLLINQRQDKLAQFRAKCFAQGKPNKLGIMYDIFNHCPLGLLDKLLLPQDIDAVDHEDVIESSLLDNDTHLQEAEMDSGEKISAVVVLAQTPCKFEFSSK